MTQSVSGTAAEPSAAVTSRLVGRRSAAVAVVALAVACFTAMAVWVHDTRSPTAIDTAVTDWLHDHIGTALQQATLGLTDPVLTVGTCAGVAVIALVARRWDVAALAVIGPLAGLLLESHVLKPAIGRVYVVDAQQRAGVVPAGWAFPSGHETGVTSVTVLLTLLVLRSTWTRLVKAVACGLAALWTAVGAFALVRSDYHYFTDTVGGVLLAVAVMITTGLLIDLVVARVSSPAGPGRSRTARAA